MSVREITDLAMRDADQECVVRICQPERPDAAASGSLPPDLAYRIVLAGLEAALAAEQPQTIVVLDDRGQMLAAGCVPGAPLQTQPIAANKAFTACTVGFDTHQLLENGASGGDIEQRLVAVIAGGVPILDNVTILGGIGVSGGDAATDHATARAALAATDHAPPADASKQTALSAIPRAADS